MNNRVRISEEGNGIRIEIGAMDHRGISLLWLAAAFVSGIVPFVWLHKVNVYMIPFWLIWLLIPVVFLFMGIRSWQWSTKGLEIFEVSGRQLMYRRDGGMFDRKRISVPSEDIKDVRTLAFGVGDNRLEIESQHEKLLCGRNLSKDEASQISELLLRWHRSLIGH